MQQNLTDISRLSPKITASLAPDFISQAFSDFEETKVGRLCHELY